MTGRMTWLLLLLPMLAAGCAGLYEEESGDNKVLASRGAYLYLQKHEQATAVFAERADEVDSELICERILHEGYKQIRTLCYTREELEGAKRQHNETFREITLFPGSGG